MEVVSQVAWSTQRWRDHHHHDLHPRPPGHRHCLELHAVRDQWRCRVMGSRLPVPMSLGSSSTTWRPSRGGATPPTHQSLWLHFIDNAAALSTLVRGASSVDSGERIAGLTWSRIVGFHCFPWFDRVESSANPTDGLSRGRLLGPWVLERHIHLPGELWAEQA